MKALKLHLLYLSWKYIVIIIIFVLFHSCDKIERLENESALQRLNLKDSVCLIVEQGFEINKEGKSPLPDLIFKFNKYGNISSLIQGDEETTCAYNENGSIIVKKCTKNVYFMGDKLEIIPIVDYTKYYYDNSAFPYKIDEFSQDETNQISSTTIERDKYNYKTKEVRIALKKNNSTNELYTDTTITIYKGNKKNNYSEVIEITGKRELLKQYKYDKNGLLIYTHAKDLFVFKDTSALYSQTDSQILPEYRCENYNSNVVYTYDRDDKGNIIHVHVNDSTNNEQLDFYGKYTYDNSGNWIKYEYYDNFHELISQRTRRIEYYPKDLTGKIDYSWENEKSPLEKEYREEKIRKQKEEKYLKDDFILEQFKLKMKEYPNYRVIGSPQITYRKDCTYNINFNAIHYYPIGAYSEKENITVQIVLDLKAETFIFYAIKGELI